MPGACRGHATPASSARPATSWRSSTKTPWRRRIGWPASPRSTPTTVCSEPAARSPRSGSHDRPRWFPDEFLWVVGCTYRGLPETAAPIRNLIGCNMSIRRTVLDEVGGFRIGRVGALSIGHENDETEICVRIRAHFPSAIILYDPAVRVVNHRVPAGRTAVSYFAKRCLSEGISKARLSKSVGSTAGLSSERAVRQQHPATRGRAGCGRGPSVVIRPSSSRASPSWPVSRSPRADSCTAGDGC